MNYIEALSDHPVEHPTVFMAGGITNCPDWQQELRELLQDVPNGTLVNPRRKDFPIHDPNAAKEQIAWEHRWLGKADYISFWFCKETLCPIVLFELGTAMFRGKPVIVGVEPGYEREPDVRIQTRLYMPTNRAIVTSLRGLANEIERLMR